MLYLYSFNVTNIVLFWGIICLSWLSEIKIWTLNIAMFILQCAGEVPVCTNAISGNVFYWGCGIYEIQFWRKVLLLGNTSRAMNVACGLLRLSTVFLVEIFYCQCSRNLGWTLQNETKCLKVKKKYFALQLYLPLIWIVGIFIFPLLNNENTDILTAQQWDYLYFHSCENTAI